MAAARGSAEANLRAAAFPRAVLTNYTERQKRVSLTREASLQRASRIFGETVQLAQKSTGTLPLLLGDQRERAVLSNKYDFNKYSSGCILINKVQCHPLVRYVLDGHPAGCMWGSPAMCREFYQESKMPDV